MAEGQTCHAPPLSMSRVAGKTVYISGCGAVNELGEFISADFEEQFRYTLEQMRIALEQAGVTFREVVSVRSYVQNPQNLPLYNRLYPEYFTPPYPTRTTIINCLPPGLEFEIDCIAYKQEPDE